MLKNLDDIQKFNQSNMDNALKMYGEWSKGWQAIASEMGDYSKRSLEDSTQLLEKLMTARTLEQAIEIQTSYAKRAYDDYMKQMTRLGGMYTEFVKEAVKPIEKLTTQRR